MLGLAYASIFVVMSDWLKRLGQARIQANQGRFTAVSDAFGAAKEVKVGGLEQPFNNSPSLQKSLSTKPPPNLSPNCPLRTRSHGFWRHAASALPNVQSGSFETALPIIALYAFSGYRLMPALQQVSEAFTQLRFASPALDALQQDLDSLQNADS